MGESFESYAAQIRRDWEARGRPPCDHMRTERDTFAGADSGDRVCLGCGATWYLRDRPQPWRGPEADPSEEEPEA
jgi:hypothetical protein